MVEVLLMWHITRCLEMVISKCCMWDGNIIFYYVWKCFTTFKLGLILDGPSFSCTIIEEDEKHIFLVYLVAKNIMLLCKFFGYHLLRNFFHYFFLLGLCQACRYYTLEGLSWHIVLYSVVGTRRVSQPRSVGSLHKDRGKIGELELEFFIIHRERERERERESM